MKHLKLLPDVHLFHRGRIAAGDDIDAAIRKQISEAAVVLLLLSPDLLNSDQVWNIEVGFTLERRAQGLTRVIPIRVRSVNPSDTPVAQIQSLPISGLPVAQAADRDQAWMQVVNELRPILCDDLSNSSLPSTVSTFVAPTATPVSDATVPPGSPSGEATQDPVAALPVEVAAASTRQPREPCIRRIFAVELTYPEPANQDLEWVGAYLFCETREVGVDRRCILLLRALRAITHIQQFHFPGHPRSEWTDTERLVQVTASVLAESDYDPTSVDKEAAYALSVARTKHFLQFKDEDWGRVEKVTLSNVGFKILEKADPWGT